MDKLDKLCNTIRALDPKIRFVGIVNERGRLIAGGLKDGLEPLDTEKDDEMLFMELALRVKMRKEFDRQLGAVKFALAVREHALAISILLDSDVLYVVAEPDADYGSLPKKILDLIS